MSPNRKDWSLRLNDSFWAYRIVYKTLIGMPPYIIVYRKACHLPLELEHKAYWAVKQLNMDMIAAAKQKKLQLCEIEEFMLFFYAQRIQQRELILGTQVLLYNSRLKLFLRKLKSRWSRPFKLVKLHPYEAVELLDKRTDHEFKVNEHRVKHYIGAVVTHPMEDLFMRNPTWVIKDG